MSCQYSFAIGYLFELLNKSKVTLEKNEIGDESQIKERRVREIRPYVTFTGNLVYHIEYYDIARVCDVLLEKVESSEELTVIGFDMEWPPNYRPGWSRRTAVIQISLDLQNCYILQVSRLRMLPDSLIGLLTHPNVRFTGVEVKSDVRKLARDFKLSRVFAGFNLNKMLAKCVDLGALANNLICGHQGWSLARLVMEFLDLRINKSKSVQMSRWDRVPLSESQQKYAAIDAYVSLLLYHALKKKEMELNLSKYLRTFKCP